MIKRGMRKMIYYQKPKIITPEQAEDIRRKVDEAKQMRRTLKRLNFTDEEIKKMLEKEAEGEKSEL
jgi:DNA-binding transcriptional MerR regulator